MNQNIFDMTEKKAAEAAKLIARKKKLQNVLSSHVGSWHFNLIVEGMPVLLTDNERDICAETLRSKFKTEIEILNQQIKEL